MGWRHAQQRQDDLLLSREPFFGPNAKATAIQFVAGLLILFFIGLPVGKYVADLGCQAIGLCSPEAAARLHGSAPQR
jgi:hypothetical protein